MLSRSPTVHQRRPCDRSRLRCGREGVVIGVVAETGHVCALVDARTDRTHLVRDDAVVTGRAAGRYVAVCGAVVLAASLAAPGGQVLPVVCGLAERVE